MAEINSVISSLGLDEKDGLFFVEDSHWKTETSFPNRVNRLIEQRIKPKAFFCFDNKPMILFFENPQDKKQLHEAVWNFNESPIVIIIEDNNVEIFNGFKFSTETEMLEKIGGADFLTDFSYFKIVTGKTWEQYNEQLNYKNRVDYLLLQNIKAARKVLVEQQSLNAKIANALIGKVIFSRYLIDREVKINFDGKLRTWTNDEFCNLLDTPKKIQAFFEYLEDKEKGFNGDLFPISNNEYKSISLSNYAVLKRLLKGEDIEKNQLSLFDFYDFSIIPIEFISNVYELFIGTDNQKKEGAYYTPLFLVDYILKETVDKKLSTDKHGVSCKVLDPACGSGIFLVETLRKIIEKYISTGISTESEEFKEAIKSLAKDNIYGIDKDLSAVQVAIFSIYLTLLDYLNPPAIEGFKFPILFKNNFFEADFFDKEADFNSCLKSVHFDYIIGNPPWMRGKGEKQKPLYVKYIEDRRKAENKEPAIDIGNREIAQAFVLRSADFSETETKCALIVTSKVLYNMQSRSFRTYFLHNFFIDRVFELAPVRREVFDKSNGKAISPACILFFRNSKGCNTHSNIVEHITLKPSRFFSLFKIFTINRIDFKKVQQSKLADFDWLWKVLVYGTYLDFNYINRLKDEYSAISEYVYTESDYIIKQGIKKKDGDKKIDVSELIDWDYIDTDVKSKKLQQYFIVPDLEKWSNKEVGYVFRNQGKIATEIFTAPAILIKDGLTSEFRTVAAMLNRNGVFTDNVTSVKPLNPNAEKNLPNILILLNSDLNAYWALQTASFVGIKQERSHDSEKFSFPFIPMPNAESISSKINTLKNKYYYECKKIFNNADIIQQEIDAELQAIDKLIFNTINRTDEEKDLMEYANNITIPLIKYKNDAIKEIKYKDSFLEDYASVFIDRFKHQLDNDSEKFVVEIWHTNQIVGMFFKMISLDENHDEIKWEKKQNNALFLSFLAKIGVEKITDKLFVQKDIRGFENNGTTFYIIKPNEKRLWHKAISYIDVDEFADAIIKAGENM